MPRLGNPSRDRADAGVEQPLLIPVARVDPLNSALAQLAPQTASASVDISASADSARSPEEGQDSPEPAASGDVRGTDTPHPWTQLSQVTLTHLGRRSKAGPSGPEAAELDRVRGPVRLLG